MRGGMSRTEDVITAYEAWDPDEESSTELAERLGISKARLYQILEREGITPKARRPRSESLATRRVAARKLQEIGVTLEGKAAEEVAAQALDHLLDEITHLRQQLAAYEERYGPLDS